MFMHEARQQNLFGFPSCPKYLCHTIPDPPLQLLVQDPDRLPPVYVEASPVACLEPAAHRRSFRNMSEDRARGSRLSTPKWVLPISLDAVNTHVMRDLHAAYHDLVVSYPAGPWCSKLKLTLILFEQTRMIYWCFLCFSLHCESTNI